MAEHDEGLPAEIALVALLFVVDAIAICVTYSRIPPAELYNVSHGGIRGGLSRVVVFSNFSTALAAIPALLILGDRGTHKALAVVGVVLCAAVFWPGVVSQNDLDVRPVNAVAGAGALVALALGVATWRRGGLRRLRRAPGDAARVAVAVGACLLALPWIAAELGFFLDGVPLLGRIFETGARAKSSAGLPPLPPAVHHGHHHGLDGLLLLTTALLLSRLVTAMRVPALRVVVGAYLALLASYAVGNMANDFWTEQIVKRGWTGWMIPNVLEPKASLAWVVIVAAAICIYSAAGAVTER